MNPGIVFYFDWEVELMEKLQAVIGSFGVFLAKLFTFFGEQLVLVAIVSFLYWGYDKKLGKRICLNLMMAINWGPMIKNLLFRRRPYFDNPGIKCLDPVDDSADIYDIEAQGFSFPSMHTASATVSYPAIALYLKKNWLKIIGIVMPLLVALSRFCLGVHYPTDVMVGLIMGYLIVFIFPKLYDRFLENDWFLVVLLLTALPGMFYCTTSDYFSGFGLFAGSVFGFIYEKHFVNFENTENTKYRVLRVLGGLAVFLLFGQGLKLILPAGNITRVIRYAIGAFLSLGVYPMAFKRFER